MLRHWPHQSPSYSSRCHRQTLSFLKHLDPVNLLLVKLHLMQRTRVCQCLHHSQARSPCRCQRHNLLLIPEILLKATLAQGTCGQKQDQQAAAAWIKKSADQNYAPAFAALAHFLSCGKGVAKDEKS